MSTVSSLSLKDSQTLSPEEARDTFSHQTLILTALTAINSSAGHPSFNYKQVNKERLQYMKEKATHTRIIDAATTILVTNTEILATIARGVNATHSIIALKETDELKLIQDVVEGDCPVTDLNSNDSEDSDVFISLPNINKTIPTWSDSSQKLSQQSSASGDHICKPITIADGCWAQIEESKNGFIFESK
jgi:hypothetical protein